MKVAIISDTHDNGTNLIKAVEIIKQRKIQDTLHLGDFCYPGILRYLATTDLRIHTIFGNNDGDKVGIYQIAEKSKGKITCSRWEYDELEIEGKKIWLQHHDDGAKEIALSGKYNAVFYGHNHTYHNEILANRCLLFNPGEICGLVTGNVSFGVWDTKTNKAEKIEINDPVIVSPFPKEKL